MRNNPNRKGFIAMSRLPRFFALSLTLCCGLALSACSDDPDNKPGTSSTGTNMPTNNPTGTSPNPTGNPTGTGTDNTNQAPACDPVGANPAMGALLNKPLAEGVQLVKKKPTHPGNPGPKGLPQ